MEAMIDAGITRQDTYQAVCLLYATGWKHSQNHNHARLMQLACILTFCIQRCKTAAYPRAQCNISTG